MPRTRQIALYFLCAILSFSALFPSLTFAENTSPLLFVKLNEKALTGFSAASSSEFATSGISTVLPPSVSVFKTLREGISLVSDVALPYALRSSSRVLAQTSSAPLAPPVYFFNALSLRVYCSLASLNTNLDSSRCSIENITAQKNAEAGVIGTTNTPTTPQEIVQPMQPTPPSIVFATTTTPTTYVATTVVQYITKYVGVPGPQGEKGERGDKGESGTPGAQGASGPSVPSNAQLYYTFPSTGISSPSVVSGSYPTTATFSSITTTILDALTASSTNSSSTNLFAEFATTTNLFALNASTTYATTTDLFVGATLRGAGLGACTGGADKLLWDDVTGTFSCGTDAGAGGGITTLNGLVAASQTLVATSTLSSDFAVLTTSSTTAIFFNIPSASLTSRGLVSTTTQTFAGDKTFANQVDITGTTTLATTTASALTVTGTTTLATTTITQADIVNASTTNLSATGATLASAFINALTANTASTTEFSSASGTITSALFVANLTATNASTTALTGTTFYSTNAFITSASTTDISGTGLTFTNGFITALTSTTASTSILSANGFSVANMIATGTATILNASTTNLSATGATLASLFATDALFTSATATNFFAQFSSTTEATTTNFFAYATSTLTGLRFTHITSASATTTSNGKALSVDATGGVILVDAGSGGGIASLNGLAVPTQFFIASSTGADDFTITSLADTHTFTIPDASLTARGFMSTSTQTFAGDKTFTGTTTLATTTASALTVTGTTTLATTTITQAEITNASTTNLSSTGGSFVNTNTTGTATIVNASTTALSASSSTLDVAYISTSTILTASTTNLSATGATLASAFINALTANTASTTEFSSASGTITSALFVANLTATNASTSALTGTTLYSTNAFITYASTTDISGTGLMFTNGFITNLTTTNASTTNLSATGASFTNTDTTGTATILNASTTNLSATGASFTNTDTTGTATILNASTTNLSATGASFVNTNTTGTATIVNASTTALSASSSTLDVAYISTSTILTASTTNLSATGATFTSAYLSALTALNASSTNLTLGISSSATGRLYFANASNNFTTQLISSSTQASNVTFTLPGDSGVAGQALISDGSGMMYWGTAAAGGVTGGQMGYATRWLTPTTLGTSTLMDDGTIIGINATSSSYTFNLQANPATNPLNVASSSGASLFTVLANGNVGVGNGAPVTKLHVGGYSANNSVDSQILISRQVDSTVSGNGHAFSDSSNVDRPGAIGYNSYDARITFSGVNNYDHYAAFQAGPTYNSTGTIQDVYGIVNIPTFSTGTVVNSYALDAWDPTGDGTVTNNYGVHIQELSKGVNNFAIYTAGTTTSYFGGKVGFGTTTPQQTLDVVGNSIVGRSPDSGSSAFSAVRDETSSAYIAMQKRGSAEGGLMGSPAGNSELFSYNSNLGLLTYSANTYLALGTANVERMRITSAGNIGIGTTTPTDKLQVAGNITPSLDATYGLGSSSLRFAGMYTVNASTTNLSSTNAYLTNASTTALSASSSTLNIAYISTSTILTASTTNLSATGATFTSAYLSALTALNASSTNLTLGISSSATGRLYFANASNNFTTQLISSSTQASNVTFTLPGDSGVAGQALISDGSGMMYWGTAAAGGVTGGQMGYATRWLTPTTLGTSTFMDSGTVVGINATSSSYTFNLQANPATNPLNIASSSGASLFTVLANGNVGVGTSTPEYGLVVTSATSSFRNIIPEANLTYTIGASSTRYKEVWTEILNLGSSSWSIAQQPDGTLSFFDAPGGQGSSRFAIGAGNITVTNASTTNLSALGANLTYAYIDSATIGTTTFLGNQLINGDFIVTGTTTLATTTMVVASTTNLSASGFTGTNGYFTGTFGVSGQTTLGNASTSQISGTGLMFTDGFITNLTIANASTSALTGTTFYSTNAFITSASTTDISGTGVNFTNGFITNLTGTTASTSILSANGFTVSSMIATGTATILNASTTNLSATGASFTNTNTTGTATIVNASTTALSASSSTLDIAYISTSTILTASTTNLSATGATFSSAYLASLTALNASSTNLTLGIGSSATGRLYFANASNNFTTQLISSTTQASNVTFTLPGDSGVAGQALISDGSGMMYWGTAAAGGVTGGQMGYATRWLTSTTLGTSTLMDDGTIIGINATSSSYTFNLQANPATNPLNIASSSGASLFTVLANGNVGIGTSTPSAPLEISSSPLSGSSMARVQAGALANSDDSYGLVGIASRTGGNPDMIIGVYGSARASVSDRSIGGYFSLGSSENLDIPSLARSTIAGVAALVANNTNVSTNIFLAQDNSVNVFAINDGGNVAVGTTTAGAKLYIEGTYGSTTPLFAVASSTSATGATSSLFTILANGKMGIGTSTPAQTLDVWGNLVVGTSSSPALFVNSALTRVGIGTTSPTATLYINGYDSVNPLIVASSTGTNLFTVSQAGYVGINNSSPLAFLDIVSASTTASLGSEMISNIADRDFSSDTGNWTGTDWVVGSGVITHTATGTNALTLNNSALTSSPASGLIYRVAFSISTTATGTLTMSIGGASGVVVGKQINNETQVMTIRAAASTALTFTPDATWTGTIDNVSVKEVTPSRAVQVLRSSNNTATLEIRTGGDSSGNTFIGLGAGSVNTFGAANQNTFMGYQSGYANIDGGANAAVGYRALYSNTTGNYNTAQGDRSLYFNTTGSSNVAQGASALYSNTTGSNNTAQGYASLYQNTTGIENTAQGANALFLNTTGSYNTAQGMYALGFNTTGQYNTAQGWRALRANTSGQNNTAIGNQALVLNTTGYGNNALGSQALASNTTGQYNLAQGNLALYANTTGNYNTALGVQTLYVNATGSNNTAVGYQALYNAKIGNNTAVGYQALYNNSTGTNNTALGYNTGLGIATGTGNTILGANITGLAAGLTNNIVLAIGTGAIKAQFDATNWNLTGGLNVASSTATGTTTLFSVASSTSLFNILANGNVGIGTSTVTEKLRVEGNVGSGGVVGMAVSNLHTAGYSSLGVGRESTHSVYLDYFGPTYTDAVSGGQFDVDYGSLAAGSDSAGLNIGAVDVAGTLKFFTGGSAALNERMRITSNGNIGIGTTTPSSLLQVAGTTTLGAGGSTAGVLTFLNANNLFTTNIRSSSTQASDITFTLPGDAGSAGTALLTDGSGLMYWGYAPLSGGQNGFVPRWLTPTTLGTSTLLDNGVVAGVNATSSSYSFNVQGAPATNPLNIASSSGTSLFTVLANGNVGIGTSSPTQKLDVWGNLVVGTSSSPALFVNSALTRIGVGTSTPSATLLVQGYDSVNPFVVASSTGTSLLTVSQGGAVGIGTSNPIASLDIVGTSTEGTLGAEMITNVADRDFSSDTGNWTGTNWTISGSANNHVAGANALTLSNSALSSAPSSGKIYQVSLLISTSATGTLTVAFGGASTGITFGTVSTSDGQVLLIRATNATALTITPNANWTGYIDTVSVKEVTESAPVQIVRNANNSIGLEIRAGGAGLTNTFIGIGSGVVNNSSGIRNIAFGYQALYSNTSASNNVALGYTALTKNTTGGQNVAVGTYALTKNTIGSMNTAVGDQVLQQNTVGHWNTAQGAYALQANISGSQNTVQGYQALYNNISGSNNTAQGYQALYSNTTGYINLAQGAQALYGNKTGYQNIAQGYQALYSNSGGYNNLAQGQSALYSNTDGYYNIAQGLQALYSNTTGWGNVAQGMSSLYYNTTGQRNIALGHQAGTGAGAPNQRSVVDTYATFIGYQATRDSQSASTTPLTNITAIGKSARVGLSNAIVLGGTSTDAVTVGIGTSTPAYTLTVQGTGATNPFLVASSSGASLFSILANGNVGIGTSTPSYGLVVTSATSSFRNIIPESNLTYTLGASSTRFKEVWTEILNLGSSTWSLKQGDDGTLSFFDQPSGQGSNRFSIGNSGDVALGNATATNFFATNASFANLVATNTALFLGNIGVGTTTPQSRVSIQGMSGVTSLFDVSSSTGDSVFSVSTQVATSGDHYVRGGPINSSFSALLQTYTNLAANQFGSINQPSSHVVSLMGLNEDSSSASPEFYGIVGVASNRNATDAKTLAAGVQGEATYQGAANANSLYLIGTGGVARNDSAFNVGSMVALFADGGQIHAGGTVTQNIGLLVQDQTVGSTMNASIYTNQSAGANNYALYMNGTGKSYFAGNIGIGTTTPGAKLTFASSTSATDGIAFGDVNLYRGSSGTLYTDGSLIAFNTVYAAVNVVGPNMFGGFNATNTLTIDSTSNAEKGNILIAPSGGNVGIGTSTPFAKFSIQGTYGSTTPLFSVASSTSSTGATSSLFIINADGNVGIGTTTPDQALTVAGTIRQTNAMNCAVSVDANGSIGCVSDERLKDIEGMYQGGLAELDTINPIKFSYKEQSYVRVGFSAQNVGSVIPEASPMQGNGYLGLDTTAVTALTVNAIKELSFKRQTENTTVSLFETEEAVDAGTVVAFGTTTHTWTDGASSTDTYEISNIKKATSMSIAIGVVSNVSTSTIAKYGETGVPVVSSGRVAVNVTNENGDIKVGDYLTVSATRPGYAMKLTEDGTSLGRALSNYVEGKEKVLVLINTGYQNVDMTNSTASTTAMLTTGNVDLNANGVAIVNIKSLASANGSWSIDENGRIIAKNVEVDNITVGTSTKGTGITIFDEITGNPYCMKMSNGALMSVPGKCSDSVVTSTTTTPSTIIETSATTTVDTSATTTDTTTATTSTETIATSTQETTPTQPESASSTESTPNVASTTPEITPTVEPEVITTLTDTSSTTPVSP